MITVSDLHFAYPSGKSALSGIDLHIEKGEFAAIVGHNGSGKSTLARIIAGIEKPARGSCAVNGIDTRDKSRFIELRKTAGIVFQNPENQIVFEKVHDDMAFALRNLGLEQDEIDRRIGEVMKTMNIEHFTNSFELSMGQKQRAAIAGVLAMQCRCIVFDEPTAMLDPKGKKDIHGIIVDLHKKGFTIVYVTNVIDEVLSADRILILDSGRIRHEFKRGELLENVEALKSFSLEMPLIMDIIVRLKDRNVNIDTSARTVDDLVNSLINLPAANGHYKAAR
ncbi:MAG: ATP-binding cassette domain-containing protein [Spirochaetaceae bacterium]|jgi:energy-coupling factor transport system ATP-binding protein|nr:ATP-binding cassette domain-containing protein [Spirochaetaceae bacterium]